MISRKRGHSVKPDELFDVIESCSPGPYLEMFARRPRKGWRQWGNETVEATANPQPRMPGRRKIAVASQLTFGVA